MAKLADMKENITTATLTRAGSVAQIAAVIGHHFGARILLQFFRWLAIWFQLERQANKDGSGGYRD